MDENARITREELKEFQEITLKEYGIELTDGQAFEQATALLNLVDHLLKIKIEEKRVERLKKDINYLAKPGIKEVK